jgi:hypothetical protein
MGDSIKHWPLYIIQQHAGLERNMGEKREVNNSKAHITKLRLSPKERVPSTHYITYIFEQFILTWVIFLEVTISDH